MYFRINDTTVLKGTQADPYTLSHLPYPFLTQAGPHAAWSQQYGEH